MTTLRHHRSGDTIFAHQGDTLQTVHAAIAAGVSLSGVDLRDADLSGANLRGADLGRADLRDADLRDAKLSGANLRGADLSVADLSDILDDVTNVLAAAPNEVAGLRRALVEGRINGSVYEGDCACLLGTIAALRGCGYDSLDGLAPDISRPAERWFARLRPGMTPENDQVAAITLGWIDRFQSASTSV